MRRCRCRRASAHRPLPDGLSTPPAWAAGTAATDAVNLGQMQASINTSQQGTVRYDSNTDGSNM